jgi:tellurite methyltransferase
VLFCRLASAIGIEDKVVPSAAKADPRWHRLPDGSDRFLVDLDFLLDQTAALNAELVSPVKTINVQNLRCMTNWVVRKSGES